MATLIAIAAFVIIFMLVAGAVDMFNLVTYGDASKTRKRLHETSQSAVEAAVVEIVRKDAMTTGDTVGEKILAKFKLGTALKLLLQQARSEMPVSVFVMISALLAAVGGLSAGYARLGFGPSLAIAVGGGLLPLMLLRRKKRKRLKRIEAQLPDALDLIARTLLAGHAFMMGLSLVADQLEDPVAEEFKETYEEINFGVSVGDAMKGLSERVDSMDVKFFVTSLLVQLETGGNLAEIIQSISMLIRSRFELLGKVQALSAEGRISATVMFSLPILLGIALYFINPDYIGLLFSDPSGHSMLIGGATMMGFGMMVTRRMVNIKV